MFVEAPENPGNYVASSVATHGASPPQYFPQTQQVEFVHLATKPFLLHVCIMLSLKVVVSYGSVQPPQRPVDPDMNTIYLSIFTMLFCCWPCGLMGLIYVLQASQLTEHVHVCVLALIRADVYIAGYAGTLSRPVRAISQN